MNQIEMVDLKSQYAEIKSEVMAGIERVCTQASFINGSDVKDFAENLQNYTKSKYVIPCANGTDALQIAFMALGLIPGDEVIVPTWTYVATAEVIALLGLKPIFIEKLNTILYFKTKIPAEENTIFKSICLVLIELIL